MNPSNEEQRIREVYDHRTERAPGDTRYTAFDSSNTFFQWERESQLLKELSRRQLDPRRLTECRLLDVGCGIGNELLRWISYGVPPAQCAGIDLISERIEAAQQRLPPAVRLCHGNADNLPFLNEEFNLVAQYTVFSSILDPDIRKAVAAEMNRVLRPGGFIIWYDFWLNPSNPQTRGIGKAELKSLFPRYSLRVSRITFAPPLARLLPRWSPLVYWLCASLKLFNTHYLVILEKPASGS